MTCRSERALSVRQPWAWLRVHLTGCVTDSNSWWFSGPYGFELADAEPLPFVPGPGRLGFFRFVPKEVPHA